MSDEQVKISDLTELPDTEGTTLAIDDILPVVDVSDTTDGPDGTTKYTSFQNLATYVYGWLVDHNLAGGTPGGDEGQLQFHDVGESGDAFQGTLKAFWDTLTNRIGFGVTAIADLANARVTIKEETDLKALSILDGEGDEVFSVDDGHMRTRTAYFEQITTSGDEGVAEIDWSLGNKQRLITSEPVTVSFLDPRGPTSLLLVVTGGAEVTWPENVEWPGGVAPDLSASRNVISFYFAQLEGDTYLGSYSLDFSVPA